MSNDLPASTSLPLQRILQESWDQIIRESDVLLPVALSFFTLGQAGIMLGGGLITRNQISLPVLLLLGSSAVLIILGRLTVTKLILSPGTSVGEAIQFSVPRIGFAVWIHFMVWLLTALSGILTLKLLGIDLSKGPEALSNLGGFVIAPAYAVFLLIEARLFLFYPAQVEMGKGMTALEKAAGLTRGRVLPMFGLVLMFILVSSVAQILASLLVSLLMGMVTAALGADVGSFVIVTLGAGMASAIPILLSTVYAARLYRHLIEKSAA